MKNEQFSKIKDKFVKKSVGNVIIQILYPSVVLYIQQKYMNDEQIRNGLFRLGEKLAENYIKNGDILNTQDYKKMIKIVYHKILLYKKIRLRQIDENIYHIEDSNCLLCGDTEIEGLNVHICTPFSGFFNTLLNELADKKQENIKEFRVETINSKWMQFPKCIHEIKIIRGK